MHTPKCPPFWDLLTPDEQAIIEKSGLRKSFRKGEFLMLEGQEGTGVHILASGYVKVTSFSTDGAEVMIDIQAAGDLVGEFAAIDGGLRSGTVTAAARVTSWLIPQREFIRLREEHPGIASAVDRAMIAKLRYNACQRTDLAPGRAFIRVCRVLVRLGDRYGEPCGEGLRDLRIKVAITQKEIASLAGCATATVQRSFSDLRNLGILTAGYRRQVITDEQRLRDIADTGNISDSE